MSARRATVRPFRRQHPLSRRPRVRRGELAKIPAVARPPGRKQISPRNRDTPPTTSTGSGTVRVARCASTSARVTLAPGLRSATAARSTCCSWAIFCATGVARMGAAASADLAGWRVSMKAVTSARASGGLAPACTIACRSIPCWAASRLAAGVLATGRWSGGSRGRGRSCCLLLVAQGQ